MSRLGLIAVVGLCGLAAACSQPAAPPSSSAPAAAPSSAPAAVAPPALSPAATAALAALPAPYNMGDPDNGRAKFALCQACHTVALGAPNLVGPNLHGVLGRKAGTLAGYSYSDAMKKAGFTWGPAKADTWLSGPMKMLPGTKMTFVGLANPQDRIDVIAYLTVASAN